MDKDREQDEQEKQAREEGERNRRDFGEVPEPGTDPLHEGP